MAPHMQVITDNLDLWTSALLTKSTAGRGSNGRVEAYGIKKLRELILELAVRGKLVPQDLNDEPASELLKRTVSEKRRLIKANVLRDSKAPLYPKEPPDHTLPNGWAWTNLYELGEISPRNDAEDSVEASFVPMQLISEKYGDPMQHEVKLWKEIKNGFTHFKEDDVVLAKITPCFQNGKSAVIRSLTNGFGSGTTELHVFRAVNACTVPEYVLIYLKSPRFIGDGIPKMTGTAGQKRITRDYFAGNHFPFPPLAEQHRIVAKVDELMALCDQLEQQQTNSIEAHQTLVETLLGTLTTPVRPELVEGCISSQPFTLRQAQDERLEGNSSRRTEFDERWTRIADHFDTLFTTEQSIDQLKQTILQLAVMGRLVPQDPDDETASVLLEKIAKEKERLVKEGVLNKEKPLPEISIEEIPYALPVGWEWERIGRASLTTDYGLSEQTFNDPTGVPVLKMGDIVNGEILLGGQKTVPAHVDGLPGLFLEEGDLLYNRTNSAELVGKTGVYEGGSGAYTFASYLIRIRLAKDFIVPRYLNICMNSPNFRKSEIEPQLKQQCGQANVNGTIMRNMRVPIPSTAEQHRIVAKVDELITLCDALKTRLADAQTTQIHLADTIVEQALV